MTTLAGICKTATVVLGAALILGGIGLKLYFPTILRSLVIANVQLDPVNNEEVYNTWAKPTEELPVLMKFTFFNVDNTEEVKAGAKPILQEVGPFTYIEARDKKGVNIVQDEITYGSYIAYTLDESQSCSVCTADTKITIINAALVGLVDLLGPMLDEFFVEHPSVTVPDIGEVTLPADTIKLVIWTLINQVITGNFIVDGHDFRDSLFTTETANKIIFEGFRPGILDFAYWLTTEETALRELLFYVLTAFLDYEDVDANDILNKYGEVLVLPPGLLPDIIADGTFAFFKGQNATARNGYFKINSGKYDIHKYQEILEFNGQPKLPTGWWSEFGPSPSAHYSGLKGDCHDIVGTEGTQYPPFVEKEDDLWLFSSQLCRSIYLSYAETVDMEGVETYQYSVKQEVLSFDNPDNFCYCMEANKCAVEVPGEDRWDMSNCTQCRNGMVSLQGCQGAPVIISLPHFMLADQDVLDGVEGLQPNPEIHTTYINVEPLTGLVLDAHKRIQVNVPTMRQEFVDEFKNIPEIVFPVVWVDEGAEAGTDSLEKIDSQLFTPVLAVDIGVGFMIGIGLVIVLVVALGGLFCSRRQRSTVQNA